MFLCILYYHKRDIPVSCALNGGKQFCTENLQSALFQVSTKYSSFLLYICSVSVSVPVPVIQAQAVIYDVGYKDILYLCSKDVRDVFLYLQPVRQAGLARKRS